MRLNEGQFTTIPAGALEGTPNLLKLDLLANREFTALPNDILHHLDPNVQFVSMLVAGCPKLRTWPKQLFAKQMACIGFPHGLRRAIGPNPIIATGALRLPNSEYGSCRMEEVGKDFFKNSCPEWQRHSKYDRQMPSAFRMTAFKDMQIPELYGPFETSLCCVAPARGSMRVNRLCTFVGLRESEQRWRRLWARVWGVVL